MIDFSLPDEAEALQSLAHRFAAEEIRPAAPALDEAEEMPWDLIRRAAELGIPAYAMPEEYGGGGFTSVLARCVVDEELYWGCAGIATAIGGTLLAATPILIGGTEDQKRAFLPPLCQAEPLCPGAFAPPEPGAGSDPSGIRTRAPPGGTADCLDGAQAGKTTLARCSSLPCPSPG